METHLTWKRKFFSNIYEIFDQEIRAGELKSSGWRRIYNGDIKGEKVLFEIKGFFDKEFIIRNPEDNSQIGQIVFNMWRTKATINIRGKEYQFQFDNFFHTKWSISNENGPVIKFESKFKSGNITSYASEGSLILTGVFIREYISQRAAASASASAAAT
jgi:hypothetical protein